MIIFRKLNSDDNKFFNKLIHSEGINYEEFLKIGWSTNQIENQFNKYSNFSFGAFYENSLICFIIGDLLNIEKFLLSCFIRQLSTYLKDGALKKILITSQ